MEIPARALAIVSRLLEAQERDPELDRARVGASVEQHFDRLGVRQLPLRWMESPERGYHAAWLASRRETSPGRTPLETAAWWAARLADQSGRQATADWARAVATASGERALGRSERAPGARHAQAIGGWRAQNAAWAAAHQAAHLTATVTPRGTSSGDGCVGGIAAELAGWAAEEPSPEADRILEVWLPFVEAYEAGMGFFWVLEQEVLAVARPALRVEDSQLHCPDGPAVVWADGPRLWFWRGVHVRQQVVEHPETLTAEEIGAVRNAEVRRVMVERFGAERYLREAGATLVQQDDWGKLWRADFPATLRRSLSASLREEPSLWHDPELGARLEEYASQASGGPAGGGGGDEPIQMVEVANATPEPDGSYRHYMLRVPPGVRTSREAVAWSFGLEPDDYAPTLET